METHLSKTVQLAREAGFKEHNGMVYVTTINDDCAKEIEHLVALVRADEREACAKFCETNQVWVGRGKRGFSKWGEEEFVTGGIHQGMDYAAAIRNRGNT
jgi:hypothetical protein